MTLMPFNTKGIHVRKKAIKGGFPVHFISTFALPRVLVLWVSFERDR
jgi:hypothetical protein